MPTPTNYQPTVIRTKRGLSIAGTRLTLYDIMDYLTAGWPPHLIRDHFQLTEPQIGDVMAYIAVHRAEVEREYQAVLQLAEENRRYWETRNRERLARVEPGPVPPEQAELRAKLKSWKEKLGLP